MLVTDAPGPFSIKRTTQGREVESANQERHAISFPEFRINRRTGELFTGSAQVSLPVRLTELLVAFAEHPGELVTRDELYACLWKGSHAQYRAGLDTAMKELRKVLSFTGVRGVIIETLRGRGYRLVLRSMSDVA